MPNRQNIFYYLTGIIALGLAVFLLAPRAKAAEPHSFNGCYVGAHGGVAHGALSDGTFDIGTTGQTAGVGVGCDVQMGIAVIGGFVEYDRAFGHLNTDAGINDTWTVGARGGLVLVPGALLYVHGGYARLGSDMGNFDGWKIGAGSEVRLPTATPLFLDVRYTHSVYDISAVAPSGIDARGDEIRLGLTWKFGGPASFVAAPLK